MHVVIVDHFVTAANNIFQNEGNEKKVQNHF